MIDYKIISKPEIKLIGYAVRTTNDIEISGNGKIPRTWEKFNKDMAYFKIPNKMNAQIYIVYCEYEEGTSGEFTMLIGAEVSNTDKIPEGMTSKIIKPGRYAKFSAENGPPAKIVPRTWDQIINLSRQSKLIRAFQADFEVYSEQSFEPQNARAEIYISVR